MIFGLVMTATQALAANGDLTVGGTINASAAGIKYSDGTAQLTAMPTVDLQCAVNPSTHYIEESIRMCQPNGVCTPWVLFYSGDSDGNSCAGKVVSNWGR